MKFFKTCILCTLFSLLAISQASAQAIVGAWSFGDTTKEEGSVIVFFANGCFIQIQNAKAGDAPHGVDGFERGTYTWNPATGAFTFAILQDLNGDYGLSGASSISGITANVSGDTAILNIPGVGTFPSTRVTGASPIVGAWGACSTSANNSAALVFLPNNTYFIAQDGDSSPTTGDPSGHDGIEIGTYSWNATTGVLTSSRSPAPYVDTDGEWGLSHPQGTQTARVSADGLILTGSDNSGSFSLARVGATASTKPDLNQHGLTGSWYEAGDQRPRVRGRDLSRSIAWERSRPSSAGSPSIPSSVERSASAGTRSRVRS